MPHSITFILSGWGLPSPGQQLLDRFLLGYPHNGRHHHPDVKLTVCPMGFAATPELRQRADMFGLRIEPDLAASLKHAQGIVLAWNAPGHVPDDLLLRNVLAQAPQQARCFVVGPLLESEATASFVEKTVAERSLQVVSGSPLNVTWRLPAMDLMPGTSVSEALIVVQGPTGLAEWEALEALLPLLQSRAGGETGIDSILRFESQGVWKAGDKGVWSWSLLAAALSRSDSPQGDPVKDGRTQDLVGLGLVPGLARDPRGWQLRHRDGLRSTLLVLDGVVADYDMAWVTQEGRIQSTQVFQAPQPAQHHYSRLAHILERFLLTGQSPWSLEHSLLIANTLQRIHAMITGG